MFTGCIRQQLVDAVYSNDELYGCMMGDYGGNQCAVLAPGILVAVNYGRVAVVVEQTALDQVPPELQASRREPVVPLAAPPQYVSNRSRVTREVLGAGLSCGLAVMSGVGVAGSAAAEVPTAGGSTIVLVLAWSGFVTAGIQCINGIVRTTEAVRNPESNSLQRWDDNRIYSTAFLIVDIIGVGSAVLAIPAAARNVLAILERRGALMGASELARLSAVERRAAIQAALRQATRTPEGAAEVERALQAAGLSARQASQTLQNGASTARRVRVVASAISGVTSARLNAQILTIVGSGLTPAVSATPSQMTGSASGSINTLIVHVFNLAQSS